MTICLPPGDKDNFWEYCGSFPAAIVLAFLFAISLDLHIFQAIRYRNTYAWTVIMCGLWEAASFAVRAISIRRPRSQGLFIIHSVLFLLAPLWINAFVYMLLGRMVNFFLKDRRLVGIKAKRMALYFVLLDIVSFIVQALGGVLIVSKNTTTVQRGLNIYTAGVALQEFFILVFIVLVVCFQRRLKAEEADMLRIKQAKRLVLVTYISLGLISIRIIFRLIEFTSGAETAMAKELRGKEIYIYVLDALPMILALLALNVLHPGKVLAGDDSKFHKMTREEKEREKAARKAQKVAKKAEKNTQYGGSSERVSNV